MSGHQQTIYTIHESQLNNNNGGGPGNAGAQRNGSSTDILIDTSSIPLTQQQSTMPPMQHQHLQPQQAQQYNSNSSNSNNDNDTITSQPIGAGASTSAAAAAGSSSSARVAPESQNVVYSVHPVFNMLDNHDTLLVRQKADCTSTCCGFESTNTYTVRSKDGSPILKAIESEFCLYLYLYLYLHPHFMFVARTHHALCVCFFFDLN